MTIALLMCRGSASAETLLVMVDSGPSDEDLLKRVAAQIETAGISVQVANASLEDSALLLGCEADEDSCLDQVASAGNADSILILPTGGGPLIARRGNGLRTTPAPGTDDEHAWREALSDVLELDMPDSTVEPGLPTNSSAEGADVATGSELRTGGESHAESTPAGVSGDVREPTGEAGTFFSRVERRSWIVVGSGAAATGLGLLFLSVAGSKQDEVNAHPTESVADLRALQDLESSGKTYTVAGNLLLVGGGLAMLSGAALMLWDNKRASRESSLSIHPTVSGDRFGISLSWSSP